MSSISLRMAAHQPSVKGVPRSAANYRSARRNAVRAAIRAAAEVKRTMPVFRGFGGYSDPLDQAA